MEISLRLTCFLGAVITFVMICRSIRKQRIQIEDSLFWVCFVALLVLIAIFPQPIFWLSDVLGFVAPSNLILVGVIAIMLLRQYRDSAKISQLKYRLDQLAQEVALDNNREEAEEKSHKDRR